MHYFNTMGILRHNDIGPQYHPTDIGHIKLASLLMHYIKMNFDGCLARRGRECSMGRSMGLIRVVTSGGPGQMKGS